ncbi:hypothetical protein [Actinoplanes xinjiangensis]|jgi:hypothetical protein|uniref:Uncharacterized protein n=1 Tax=Actinoplanes xinjiangensis TaxID=512350 RepID=A0A316FCJ3_9ACTN|nr:hypothetical protein [Actinoplanes xinjiangensis]PWK45196.1 hypothetical protein BC793_111170 [Actinoplanes xinjiangensis]GIF41469.1 hypothetical protein Axi01nite_57800 [Actinoplanes xinjiangensis]
MRDVAEINTTQPRDWKPTEEQVRRAERNDAYPPAGKRVAAAR